MHSQRSAGFRFGVPSDMLSDRKNKGESTAASEQQAQSRAKRTETEELRLQWDKPIPIDSTVGDCRRGFMNAMKSMQSYGYDDLRSKPEGVGMSLNMNSKAPNWKIPIKRSLPNPQVAQGTAEESDSNDTDHLQHDPSQPPATTSVFQTSPRADSMSKASSQSFNEDIYNDAANTPPFNLTRTRSSTFLHESSILKNATHSIGDCDRDHNTNDSWPQEADMNLIMVAGLVIGLVISKALQYLQLYFTWFQQQILQVRNTFLGPCTFWEFCNFEDTTRYGVRTKLLLLPIVALCSLLYGIITLLHFAIRFLLTKAPNGLVGFIQKMHSEV